jgi:hypothetical protein
MTPDKSFRHATWRRTGRWATAAVLPTAIATPWPMARRGFSVEAGHPDLTVQAHAGVRHPETRMDA